MAIDSKPPEKSSLPPSNSTDKTHKPVVTVNLKSTKQYTTSTGKETKKERPTPSSNLTDNAQKSVVIVDPKSTKQHTTSTGNLKRKSTEINNDNDVTTPTRDKQASKNTQAIKPAQTKERSDNLNEKPINYQSHLAKRTQETPSPIVSERELRILLGRLVSAYERGDLTSFMSLFSKQARVSGAKGKTSIQQEYKKLFYSTHYRRMNLKDIVWRPVGDIIRGDGRFYIEVRAQSEQRIEKHSGRVIFEVKQENGRLLIRGFYHHSDS
ncbi:MAG: hypothetical protein R3F37_04390 [Candidatus Competibacteraceae bacterium]